VAIDRQVLETELLITSGEYFSNTKYVITSAVDNALREYSSLFIIEKVIFITTVPTILEYDLPEDFKEVIDVYRDQALYAALYTSGYIDVGGIWAYNVVPQQDFLGTLMTKMEYYRNVEVMPKIINWTIDAVTNVIVFNNVPDTYDGALTYIIHYIANPTTSNVPDYHREYIYKLASAILMTKQALAMSKIIQTSGPTISSTYVSPQVLLTMAKDLKTEVFNALCNFIPERG
jgi:hypothetical protein